MLKPYRTILFIILLCSSSIHAQQNWPSPEVEQMYNTANNQLVLGNTEQAITLFQQAIKLAPNKMVLYRDLGEAYKRAGNYKDGLTIIEPVIKSGEADDKCYQIYASCLAANNEKKKAHNVLADGLKRFPSSGLLHHEMGIYYDSNNEQEKALLELLTGIELAPGFSANYYEAARMYMGSYKLVWAVIYAEIFMNLEKGTPKSDEAHDMLLGAYMRLYNSMGNSGVPQFKADKDNNANNDFETAVYDTYLKLSPVVSDGITTENLTMLRTRFSMDWQLRNTHKYPFTLFSRYDNMLRIGFFDAYNQWAFAPVDNPQQYEAWKSFHTDAIPKLEGWIETNPYIPVQTDFYNRKEVHGIFPKPEKEKGKKK